eukprot:CAMPEP_0201582744 /NCGR_PEP_ID=MMETSP0190_2-20130828/90042_1 /ASSEMBLY_ACC=CAM_ASM_000263 /TAXON_ID=37353 /ORGANISM="Rosalina sp." /LENGTH=151 /DNA_ID=CAMNT_0048023337 /DNA_START=157 /DNA_END=609 /DNA_ORIENTATION=+
MISGGVNGPDLCTVQSTGTGASEIQAVAFCDELDVDGVYPFDDVDAAVPSVQCQSGYVMTSCTGYNGILAGSYIVTNYGNPGVIADDTICNAAAYYDEENPNQNYSVNAACFPRIQGNFELKCRVEKGLNGVSSTAMCQSGYYIYGCSGYS